VKISRNSGSRSVKALAGVVVAGIMAVNGAYAGTTNRVGYAESFESYTNGFQISGTNGWGAWRADAGIVVTNVVNNGVSCPIPGSHTNVLQLTDEITNTIVSPTGGVVVLDFMAVPEPLDPTNPNRGAPAVRANWHYAFYLNTSSNLVLWHYNKTGASNEWTTLTSGPVVTNGVWTRFTIVQDYRNALFQMRVNNGAWITDATAWTGPGGSLNGSWFYMVQTNVVYTNMSLFGIGAAQTNYVDDVVLTNRQVTWSGNSFTESVTNDGTIANSLTLGIIYDTFNATNNEVLGPTKVQVQNLPSNLTAVATYSTNTAQLTVTLTGAATNHLSAHNVSNLTIRLLDPAFTLGNAADVSDRAQTNLTVVFRDQPVLTWGGNTNFYEVAANDGSIGTTNVVTLSGDTFVNGTYTETQFTNWGVPAGLTCVVWSVNSETAMVTLAGNATYHTNANSTSFTLQFLSPAFSNVAASNITGIAANLAITFSNQPSLSWDLITFLEPSPPDDGSIETTNTVTLSAEGGATFVGPKAFADVTDFTAIGVPAGLTCAVWSVNSTNVKVTLTGNATANAQSDSTNFTLAFGNSMFSNVAAANIIGFSRNDLDITFLSANRGALLYPDGMNFTEAGANDGSVSDSRRVILSGTTFTNATYVENTQFAASGVPQGLTCTVTYVADNRVNVGFTGKALTHNASTVPFTLTFKDAAFTGLTVDKIDGCVTNLAIHFNDQPVVVFGPPTTFAESVTNNGSMGNTVPVVMTVQNGASFRSDITAADCDAPVVPAGLGLAVTYTDPTHVTLALTNRATSHTDTANGPFAFAFKDTAFNAVPAVNIGGYSTTLSVAFSNQPSLTWDPAPLTEGPANDGSIATTNTVTLSGGASFKTGPFSAGTHYTTSNVPAGLTCVVLREDTTHVKVTLAGKAVAHDGGNPSFNLQFLDGAFDPVAAVDIVNSSNSVAIAYSNQPSLNWGGASFTEAAANDGSIGTTNTVTLSSTGGATFKSGAFSDGNQFTKAAVPAGLTCAVTYVDPTNVHVTLTGRADSHTSASNTSFNLQFNDTAFNTVVASNITANAASLAISFHDQPSLSWDNTTFTEAAANDGSIATTNTVTLSATGGATFKSGPFSDGNQFTKAGVPAGLTCVVTYVDPANVKVALTGRADSHTSASNTSFNLQFNDTAFNTVAVANITGNSINLAVQFGDPATLTYNGSDTFTEASQGTINSSSLTITLAHDTFTGAPGDNFVASNKVSVTHLPVGLTAVITRSSDIQLSVQLTGTAYYNDQANSVTDLTFQFQDTAFNNVAASRVVNALKADLKINFVNDTPFSYAVPYVEPFEGYARGAWMTQATNGWLAEYAGAGEVVNTNTVGSWTHAYQGPVPVTTTHTNELYIQYDIRSEIRSIPGQTVYLDFSVWPAPMVDTPQVSAAMQYAFYVSTNGEFVIWHQKRTGGVTNNELRVLSNAPVIDTNRWLRVTVCQDYSKAMFQVRLNNGEPITDADGWTAPGGTTPGSWFHMVQTNNNMSIFGVVGAGSGYIDDLTVRTNLVNQTPVVLTLSPTVFTEAGDTGYIDNSNSNRISLTGAIGATFAGNDGDVYNTGCVAASILPSNLSVVLARTSPTNLGISLAGMAAPSNVRDGVSNVVVSVLDGAFDIGAANIAGAANILGASQSGLRINFTDSVVGTVYLIR